MKKHVINEISKKISLVALSCAMFVSGFTPMPVQAKASPKQATFHSADGDNLFMVEGYGDLIIGRIQNDDNVSITWCLNKRKPFPRTQGVLYENVPDENNWSWDLGDGVYVDQANIKSITNVVYANNYVFQNKQADYGLEPGDTMSVYHASQIAIWAIAEGWHPSMVVKQPDVVTDPIKDALADKIHAMFVDIYNYATNPSQKTYIAGATLYDYTTPSNLTVIGDNINLTETSATDSNYYRSTKMYYVPNQNRGYVADGDLAYTYRVEIGQGAPKGTRIVNEYGVEQYEFSTRLTNPIGTSFYIEVPKTVDGTGVAAGSVNIKVETKTYVREAPMVYTPVSAQDKIDFQTLMQYYGEYDYDTRTISAAYPANETTTAQLGQVNVYKEGLQLDGFNIVNTVYGQMYQPKYAVRPLANAKFKITYKDAGSMMRGSTLHQWVAGGSIRPDGVDAIANTGASGYFKTTKVSLDKDTPSTTIVVEEIQAPTGFTLDTITTKEMTINRNNGMTVGEVSFRNTPTKVNFEFNKVLVEDGIPDAVGKGTVFGFYTKEAWGDAPAGALLGVAVADANGRINQDAIILEAGREYLVKELKAPYGYKLDPTVYTLDATIPAGQENAATLNLQLKAPNGTSVTTISNYVIDDYRVAVNKTDADTAQALAGATIGLYKEDGTLLEQIVTVANNTQFNHKLKYGSYYLQEIAPPSGYQLSTDKYPFVINENSELLTVVGITNTQVKVAIEVIKTDEVTGQPIANVEFELYDSSNNLVDTALTDAQGKAVFLNVAYANYNVREKSLPHGYIGELASIDVNLTDAPLTAVTTVRLTNTPFVGSIVIEKVDAKTQAPLAGAVFEITKDETVIDTATTDAQGKATFRVPFGTYQVKEIQAPINYVIDTTPKTVVIDNVNTHETVVKFENQLKPVTINVSKVNKDTRVGIPGVTIELYDRANLETLIDSKQTDNNGLVSFSNLPASDYVVIEKELPAGYVGEIATANVLFSGVNYQAVKSVTLENTPFKAKIQVVKIDKDTGNNLPGAVFELYKGTTLLETATTDSTGVAKFVNVYQSGTYGVKETKAPADYVLNDAIIPFVVSHDGGDVQTVTAENVKYSVGIDILKKDAEDSKPIKDVQFGLYLKANPEVAILKVVTDENGKASFNGLVRDSYIVKEEKLPYGYTGALFTQDVDLTSAAQNSVVNLNVTNTAFKANVIAVKLDKDDANIKLKGATYELYSADNKLLATATSDDNGNMNFNVQLRFGDYYLKEKTAPYGYNLNTEKVVFKVNSIDAPVVNINVTNAKKTANLKVEKVDNDNDKTKLKDAEFKLFWESDKELKNPIKTVTTDSNGQALISGLNYGKYYLVETKAPGGYKLDSKKILIETNGLEHDETLIITVRNVKETKDEKPKPPTVDVEKPVTGELGSLGLVAGLTAVALLGAATLLFIKKRNSKYTK